MTETIEEQNMKPQFSPLAPLPEGDTVNIEDHAERAYLEYAISVVKGRALPEVCDGLKPVQRRILFAMRELSNNWNIPHKKSARIVGEVLGKFHPHGDSSVYDAMVRTAQDFSLRYPLVDGQGNFGSRDGDNAAAMRYTEVRLAPISDLLLSELDMGTVDFQPNYNGEFQEPSMLPARLPMVLLNGASGIAVGMATEIPSHNLTEVSRAAYMVARNPSSTDDEIMSHIVGPDFPGGGQITSSAAAIRECYTSGRGSIRMRARWAVEQLARGQWQVVVNELPHGVSTQKVLEEISELTNPKIKANKKALTQEQVQNKQIVLSVLDTVADESDKDQSIRLVFQPKSSKQNVDDLMSVLLTKTSLQTSVPVNLTMIGLDGRPQQKSLSMMIREWVQFRLSTVTRRTRHRLGQVNARLHILEGRLTVFLNIDEVIAIIRAEDDPKARLMERFSLSDIQADDILDIRLRQLARLEGVKIEKEIKELKDEAAGLERILGSDKALRDLVTSEIAADAKKYGDDRRTLIEEVEQIKSTVQVVDEPMTVFVSKRNWVRSRQGHDIDQATITFKDGDSIASKFECRSTDQCIVVCDNGRVISVPVSQIPSGRGDGAPLATFVEVAAGAKIVHTFCGPKDAKVLISTSGGYGFVCSIEDMIGRNKAGKQFITVVGSILPPKLFTPSDESVVAVLSKDGRFLMFSLPELNVLAGGGKGMMLLNLKDGDELIDSDVLAKPAISIVGSDGKKTRHIEIGENYQDCIGKRAKAGKVMDSKLTVSGFL